MNEACPMINYRRIYHIEGILLEEEYLCCKASYVVLNGVYIPVNLQFFFLICVRWSIILIVRSVQPPKSQRLAGIYGKLP